MQSVMPFWRLYRIMFIPFYLQELKAMLWRSTECDLLFGFTLVLEIILNTKPTTVLSIVAGCYLLFLGSAKLLYSA